MEIISSIMIAYDRKQGYEKRKMGERRIADLIKQSLWGIGTAVADRETYDEMKRHAIAGLPASCLSVLGLPPELEQEWKQYILRQIAYNTQCNYAQSVLPISVPYVILKGTSAAQYYPHPEYRAMGDIDIMTRREDLKTACNQLVAKRYCVAKELNREIALIKDGIAVELHQRFAILNDPEQAKYLDDLIIENITPSHALPDLVNGLVLLEHIDQHMEGGIGLRQIIDWMMFVDKCLPDEKWPEFLVMAEKVGLEKLAIVCTRMCELYLGLPQRKWCADAEKTLCEQLMDYVMACGNFGNKKTSDEAIIEDAIAYASTPKTFFTLLQKQGLKNWKSAKDHKILRPFAWVYQGFRYASKGIRRDRALSKLKEEYTAARQRNKLFDALGVKTMAKGDVVYRDGKYIKE